MKNKISKNKRLLNVLIVLLMISAMIPIIVTPVSAATRTSFTEYNGQNGRVLRSGDGSWNTAVTTTTATAMSVDMASIYNSPTSNNCQRTILFYDTSSIPDDATIVGVNIRFPTLNAAFPTDFVYVNKALVGSSLDINDYNRAKYTTLFSKYDWTGTTASFNLTFNQNISTSINKTGLSTFVVRFAKDYLNSPPSSEYGFECADEHLIKLWVNYTLEICESPIIDSVLPVNASTLQPVLPEYTLSATIHHMCEKEMNITFQTNSTGPWQTIGSNLSIGNGTYRQYCDTVGNGYNTKYWWRIILNDGTNWTNATYHFTTIFDSNTHAVYDGNYETNESSIVVTADGGFGVDNVSLYFKFSPDNTSGWYPSAPTGELLFNLTDSHSITYPQRLWFDEENQRMFIAGYATSQLLIWDVEKQWDMHQLYSIAATNIHDVKAINNWSYGGREYGNIAMACVGSTTHNTLQTFRCNLSTAIASLDTYDIGVGGSVCPGYLDYFVNETGHLIVVQTKMTEPGNITIFDISNPTDIQVLKRFTTHNNEPWNPFFYDNGHHLMISFNDDNSLMNNTPELYDVTNLRNPVYVGPLYDLGIGMSQVLTCWSSTNPNLAYGARAYYDVGHPSTRYCKLVSYDCSDAENWIELSNVDITSNGEWQLDYTTNDWAAVRGYKYGETRHQVDFYYVGNPYNMTPAGTYTNVDIITSPHIQWLDMTHSRGFFLDYSKHTFFSLNITVNETDLWELFETDESEPWSWNFDFPNETGYYCLMTRSSTDGELESIPLTADEFVFYNPDYVQPMNNLPVVNESMPRIENTSIHMIWKYAAVDVDDLMTLMGNFTNMTVTKYNYITHVWNEVTTVNLNDLINITVNYSELPFKDTFITIIPQIRVFVYDGDGDVVNVSLYTNSTGNWTLVDYHTITPVGFITSGWINFYDYDMDEYNTTYYYRIVTNDTTDEITTNFSFTTGIESIIIPPVTGDDYMMYTIGIVVLIALVAMLYLLLKRKR